MYFIISYTNIIYHILFVALTPHWPNISLKLDLFIQTMEEGENQAPSHILK